MPQKQDSVQIQTVIAYPKEKVILTKLETSTTFERISFVGEELYKPNYDQILLCGIFIATFLLFVSYLQIKKVPTRSGFLSYFFQSVEREETLFSPIVNVLQHALALVVCISLTYFLLENFFNFSNSEILAYVTIGFLGYILLYTLLIFLTGYFIADFSIAKNHYRITRALAKQLGLLLFPFLFVALLLPNKGFSIVLWGIVILFLLKKILQIFFVYKLLRTRKFSVFHSFLYLCTLEILPLIYLMLLAGCFGNNN